MEKIDLVSWAKESKRRNELVETYLVNRNTNEVIFVPINPHFIAGIVKFGLVGEYELKEKGS